MADIGSGANWLVSPTAEVEDMWKRKQIQEKKSQVAAALRALSECKQKIEDLQNGVMLDINARIIMLKKEIGFLELERKQKSTNGEVINVDKEE